MNLNPTERPSALPAVSTQVVAVPAGAIAIAWPVVRIGSVSGGPRLQSLTQPCAFGNAGGFAGTGIDHGKYAMDRVSGVPPRGRPV